MKTWILECPNCGTPNEAPKEAVSVNCGNVYYRGRCKNCKKELEGQQEYWRWLGLEESPPPEDLDEQG
jgi:hypothetical protein